MNWVDTLFVLMSGAMVFFMIPGLAFFYSGFVNKDQRESVLAQSFATAGLVSVLWWAVGFTLVFGKDVGGVIGDLSYLFLSDPAGRAQHPNTTISTWAFFFFQMKFAVITPALIVGVFFNRLSYMAHLVFTALWSLLVYAVVAHAIWGGGLFAKWGAIDFAGGTAVHIAAGMSALAAVLALGWRDRAGETKSHTPYVALGTGILWFGWFGFNGGSALAINDVAVMAFVNTHMASAAAMLVWLFLAWLKTGKADVLDGLTGAVAGLVAITPACGFVTVASSIAIGAIAGVVCYYTKLLRENIKLADSLDVWAVHGIGGIIGSVCTGIFASPAINNQTGLLYGGWTLFKANLGATTVTAVYAFVATYLLVLVIKKLIPKPVSETARM